MRQGRRCHTHSHRPAASYHDLVERHNLPLAKHGQAPPIASPLERHQFNLLHDAIDECWTLPLADRPGYYPGLYVKFMNILETETASPNANEV